MLGDLITQKFKSQVGIKLLFLVCGESLLKFMIISEDNKCMDNKNMTKSDITKHGKRYIPNIKTVI